MREIGKLDELLLAKGFILHRYSCHILSTILALISFYMLGTACYYMQLLSSHFHYHQLVLLNIYGLQLFISNLYALCLRVLLGNIRQRIHLVNAKLELVAKSDLDVEHNWRQMSLFIELLCKFRFITDKVNTSNGIALFSYMSFAFYMLTNQSFMAFMTIVKPQGYEEKYDILGVSLAWIFVELVTILVICSACDDLSSER
ncbi:gustatory receptor 68a-like [Ceratitis capitata]|uniref:gustatory receptor 68a-like n=1 Tax=Ceratitis capitata TaxID=7213 RepID=UPI00032A2860|nr:gustatory receptor 68a-like [Ceratitis capitata]